MVDKTLDGWYNPAYAWPYAPLHSVILVVSDHVQNLPFWELMQKVLVVHLTELSSIVLYCPLSGLYYPSFMTAYASLHSIVSAAFCQYSNASVE